MLIDHVYLQPSSDVLILLSSPTKDDHEKNQALSGSVGIELAKLFMRLGYDMAQVSVVYCHGNPISPFAKADGYHPIFKKKSQATDTFHGIPVTSQFTADMEVVCETISKHPAKLIIGMGDIASLLLSGNPSSDKMRGSMLHFDERRTVICRDPRLLLTNPEVSHAMQSDLARAIAWGLKNDPPFDEPQYSFKIAPTFQETIQYLTKLKALLDKEPTILSVDLETVGSLISCIGIADSPFNAICIPFMRETDAVSPSYFTAEQELYVLLKLRDVLTHPNAQCVGQNFAYDIQYCARNWGFVPKTFCDTMIAYHTCFSADSPKSLDYLASLFVGFYRYWKDESRHRGDNVSDQQHWEYNCKDCVYTYELVEPLLEFIRRFNLTEQYEFQMRMQERALRPMLMGTKWDHKAQGSMGMDIAMQITQYERVLDLIIDEELMPRKKKQKPYYNSPAQLKKLLYDVLQLPVQKDKKTKKPSTADAALKSLMKIDPILKPWLKMILDYRSLCLFRNNYLACKLDHDGYIRTSYNVAGTSTYRFSSSKDCFGYGLNLQNISKGKE